ncbi:hypothetical protein GIB67_017393 [Kingdonia uniflora]|uniref:Uncharacterized protein n=1 Tax=Kingdonia uniflora TaxID=39325 RepID=A0A7J7M4B4_9MAGN|nr:hypothetical protein GIB67_017393 [Kingdonia uniflora]
MTTMESLIGLVNIIEIDCTKLNDYGGDDDFSYYGKVFLLSVLNCDEAGVVVSAAQDEGERKSTQSFIICQFRAPLSTSQLDRCSCGKLMDKKIWFNVLNDGVLYRGRMLIVIDDRKVIPQCTKDLGNREVVALEVKITNLDLKEVLVGLLRLSFTSMTPLTAVLLKSADHTPTTTKVELEETYYILKIEDTARSGVSSAARAKIDFKLARVSWYKSDLVESDLVAMAEGPNATDPTQVLAPQVGGPSVNPRPLNIRTRLDQLEDKMQSLSGIIDQVTTLEERLDGFSDDQAHVGERLVTSEVVVEGNMATILDQVVELSSTSSSQSHKERDPPIITIRERMEGNKLEVGETKVMARTGVEEFQGRPGNLKCFLCGGNHKAYQYPHKTALNALMASHGDQADDTTQGNDSESALDHRVTHVDPDTKEEVYEYLMKWKDLPDTEAN